MSHDNTGLHKLYHRNQKHHIYAAVAGIHDVQNVLNKYQEYLEQESMKEATEFMVCILDANDEKVEMQ